MALWGDGSESGLSGSVGLLGGTGEKEVIAWVADQTERHAEEGKRGVGRSLFLTPVERLSRDLLVIWWLLSLCLVCSPLLASRGLPVIGPLEALGLARNVRKRARQGKGEEGKRWRPAAARGYQG